MQFTTVLYRIKTKVKGIGCTDVKLIQLVPQEVVQHIVSYLKKGHTSI
jgi:hypothetical protein